MKPTHTQGPWTTQQIDGVLYIETVDGDELAMLGPVEGQNRLANGKLMAAAPDLLHALELSFLVISGNAMTKKELCDALLAAKEAIAKATA